MRTSRKIWGWFVFALGLLWFVGGLCGYFQGDRRMLLLIFLGFVLLRMGWNITHAIRNAAGPTEETLPDATRWNIAPRNHDKE